VLYFPNKWRLKMENKPVKTKSSLGSLATILQTIDKYITNGFGKIRVLERRIVGIDVDVEFTVVVILNPPEDWRLSQCKS
jgi:hypothetical protein